MVYGGLTALTNHHFYRCLAVLAAAFLALAADRDARAESMQRPDPYFASLASNEANIRKGPGLRYPIAWVFQRANLPVEVIDQFNNWRQVRFHTGQEGWAYHTLLSGRRYGLITGEGDAALRRLPRMQSPRLLLAAPGVIVRLTACRRDWCEAEVNERSGWLPKDRLWGVRKGEVFGE